MRKIAICLNVFLSLYLIDTVEAQHLNKFPSALQTQKYRHREVSNNYVGLEQFSLAERPKLSHTTEDKLYIEALSKYIRDDLEQEEIIDLYLQNNPTHLDRGRLRLLLAYAFYHKGQETNALALLQKIKLPTLLSFERDQVECLLVYLYLTHGNREQDIAQARAIISGVRERESDNVWSEQVRLYEGNILWYEGKPKQALTLIEREPWSQEIMPEVEYLGALLSFALDNPRTALSIAQKLLRQYPEMHHRPRLRAKMAEAYYLEAEYSEAIKILTSEASTQEVPPREERYLLGICYYESKDYERASKQLREVITQDDTLSSLAQFALGNIARLRDKGIEAQLAYEAVLKSPYSSTELREKTSFQLIEMGYAGGLDAFGQQIKKVEDFLINHPQSPYRKRVLELVEGYISRSSNYSSAISLIDRLGQMGIHLKGLKQEVLVRHALALGMTSDDYTKKIIEAISLGALNNEAYTIALTLMAEVLLKSGDYAKAESMALRATQMREGMIYQGAIATYYLAYSLYNQSRYDEACRHFEVFSSGGGDRTLRADALLRSGDCYLKNNRLKNALTRYEQANQTAPNGVDEALYRIAGIYGKQGKYREQIETISKATSLHPNSPYLPNLFYDRGRAEVVQGKTLEARRSFTELIRLYPNSPIAPTASLELALLYNNEGQEDEAIKAYKAVIEEYPESKESKNALADLRSIYEERNQLDEYAHYVRSRSLSLKDHQEDEAHLSYLAIESRAKRGEEGVITELEDFLKHYPEAPERLKALRLLSESYLKANKAEESVSTLIKAREIAQGELWLNLSIKLGDTYASTGRIQEAYSTYNEAYKRALGTKLYSLEAGTKLLSTATKKQSKEAIAIAKVLLKRQDLSNEQHQQIRLMMGKLQDGKEALATLSSLGGYTNSPYGAEATILRADNLFKLNRLDEARGVLNTFVSSGSSQSYWLARAFILLSDIAEKEGDRYLAKQYLESLEENYTGVEEDIKSMIAIRKQKYANQS